MSDMRLTSSKTKMKIILCIFLLCNTAVSVFGEPQELNGVVGESVKFPAAVKIEGSLRYSGVPIGEVASSRFTPPRNGGYSGRVQWDSSTGLFSLSGLRLEDSGVYTVQNTQQNINTTFQLNVYKDNVNVSKPHVSVTHDEYPCTLLCTVERGTGVTLTLYENGEKNPYVTSPVESAPNLHLPQTVESGTYTCEAKNSVSRETSDPLPVGAHCTAPAAPAAPAALVAPAVFGDPIICIIIAGVFLFLVALVAYVLWGRIRCIKSELKDTRSELKDTRSELKDTRSELEGIRSELKDTRSELVGIRSDLKDIRSVLKGHFYENPETWGFIKSIEDRLNIEGQPSSSGYIRREFEDIRREFEGLRSELKRIRNELKGDAVQPVPQSGIRSQLKGDAVQPVPQSDRLNIEGQPSFSEYE